MLNKDGYVKLIKLYPSPSLNRLNIMVYYLQNMGNTRQLVQTWGRSTMRLSSLSQPDPIFLFVHYNDVIMSTMASQITSLTIVYPIVYLSADQRKHQSSALLAFVRGIHRRPVNSPHKGLVTRKMCPFDDVIMIKMPYAIGWHWCPYYVHHFACSSMWMKISPRCDSTN